MKMSFLHKSEITQAKNSLENLKRELSNVQAKIVNLRLQEKNLIKIIKKRQEALKKKLSPSPSAPKKILEGIFLNSSDTTYFDLFIEGSEEFFAEPTLVNPDLYV